ncbi:MAG: dihydrolipoyl dehydrogenase [Candidatus Omnitrophota bacterium]|nr:dihydrolipoyl dehydrogenase [Candidatus Omnitrophota bacterium]
MKYDYDLAIIGAGWAGFNATRRAKKLGLKVCLIEKSALGGTCLNRGCIPTKALLQSTKAYSLAKKSPSLGIEIPELKINLAKIQERKNKIIRQLQAGMQSLLAGIDYVNSPARLKSDHEISLEGRTISAKYTIVATGSQPVELAALKFNRKNVLSSDEILEISELPQSLLIAGGGVIGCEFASFFAALGTRVTIVEKMPRLLPAEDQEVSQKITALFKKKGISVNVNADAAGFNPGQFGLILSCVGRIAATSGLGLEELGVKMERGRVITDEYLRTNIANILAAGDCTGRIMLAHYASYLGIIAAENCAAPEHPRKCDNFNIPNCIFTDPEIASVGLSDEAAKEKNIAVNIHRFDFLASGMARILDETDGFLKIISSKDSGEIIGASIIGPRATELISALTIAVTNRLEISQLKNTIFAHPTISESIHEALSED